MLPLKRTGYLLKNCWSLLIKFSTKLGHIIFLSIEQNLLCQILCDYIFYDFLKFLLAAYY